MYSWLIQKEIIDYYWSLTVDGVNLVNNDIKSRIGISLVCWRWHTRCKEWFQEVGICRFVLLKDSLLEYRDHMFSKYSLVDSITHITLPHSIEVGEFQYIMNTMSVYPIDFNTLTSIQPHNNNNNNNNNNTSNEVKVEIKFQQLNFTHVEMAPWCSHMFARLKTIQGEGLSNMYIRLVEKVLELILRDKINRGTIGTIDTLTLHAFFVCSRFDTSKSPIMVLLRNHIKRLKLGIKYYHTPLNFTFMVSNLHVDVLEDDFFDRLVSYNIRLPETLVSLSLKLISRPWYNNGFYHILVSLSNLKELTVTSTLGFRHQDYHIKSGFISAVQDMKSIQSLDFYDFTITDLFKLNQPSITQLRIQCHCSGNEITAITSPIPTHLKIMKLDVKDDTNAIQNIIHLVNNNNNNNLNNNFNNNNSKLEYIEINFKNAMIDNQSANLIKSILYQYPFLKYLNIRYQPSKVTMVARWTYNTLLKSLTEHAYITEFNLTGVHPNDQMTITQLYNHCNLDPIYNYEFKDEQNQHLFISRRYSLK